MRRVILSLCALVGILLTSCNTEGSSQYDFTQQYAYAPYVELSDTTFLEDGVENAAYRMDTLLFRMLQLDTLAGLAVFSAAGSDLLVVDSMLVSQVRAQYYKMLPGVIATNYFGKLSADAPFFRGNVMIVYGVRNVTGGIEGEYIERDTIISFPLGGMIPKPQL